MKYYRKLQHRSKNLTLRLSEGVVFLRRFVGAPRQVGSVTPSSPYLTRAMLDKIDWNRANAVAELGAGTGVFTRAIVRKMKDPKKLLVFEIDQELKSMIEAEIEGLSVNGDACELPGIMEKMGISQLDYVVSSLPFAVIPPRMTASILDAVDFCLKPGGKLIAYQYSKHMKPYFEKRFDDVRISFVLRNVPPAFVYECTKADKK